MKRFLCLGVLSFLFASGPVYAKSKSIQDRPHSFYFGAHFQFTDSAADDVLGASYRQKMTNPVIGVVGLGFRLFGLFYLGARYENWFTTRDFTVSGMVQKDTLKYQSLGGEFGFYRGNPRFFWTLTAGWFHPLVLSVASTRSGVSSTYQHEPKQVTYQARLTVGVKLNSTFSFRLEGGYHYANFGDLSSNGSSLLPNGEKLDLSGPFAGVGLGIHF